MRWSCFAVFCLATLAGPACRRTDPPPSHHEDLGDQSQPLLPTAQTWQPDRHVLEGTAEFQPLREPKLAEKPEGTAEGGEPATGGDDAKLKEELQDLVRDHNEVLAKGSADEISDFYVEAQIEPVKALVSSFSAVRDKIRELASAIPEKKDDLERLATRLSPETLLNIEFKDAQPTGEGEASARLTNNLSPTTLLGGDTAADGGNEITFRRGEGDWYIESQYVPLLAQWAGTLGDWAKSLDPVIADAKAGSLKAADLPDRAPELSKLLENLPPAEVPEPSDDGAKEGEPDDGDDEGAAPEEDGEAPAEGEGEGEPESDNGGDSD